jgi:hypothetical protein
MNYYSEAIVWFGGGNPLHCRFDFLTLVEESIELEAGNLTKNGVDLVLTH